MIRARIACAVISIGIRMLPIDLRTQLFVRNAMKTGHVRGTIDTTPPTNTQGEE